MVDNSEDINIITKTINEVFYLLKYIIKENLSNSKIFDPTYLDNYLVAMHSNLCDTQKNTVNLNIYCNEKDLKSGFLVRIYIIINYVGISRSFI